MLGRVASRHGRGEVEAAVALHQAVQVLVLRLLKQGRNKVIARGWPSIALSECGEWGQWLQGCPSKKSNFHMVKLISYVVFREMFRTALPAYSDTIHTMSFSQAPVFRLGFLPTYLNQGPTTYG